MMVFCANVHKKIGQEKQINTFLHFSSVFLDFSQFFACIFTLFRGNWEKIREKRACAQR